MAEGIFAQTGQSALANGISAQSDQSAQLSEPATDKSVDGADLLRYGSRVYFVVEETRGMDWMSTYMAARFPGTKMEVTERLAGEDRVFLICKVKGN